MAQLQTRAGGDVLGLGIDLVEIAEFERLPSAEHAAFYARCFSQAEREYCLAQAVPAGSFAARFAAKEAAFKAFSQIESLAYWQIEVTRSECGTPGLRLWNVERTGPLPGAQKYRMLLSLTHTDGMAAAVVLVCTAEA